jgi:hypothetical protein
MPQTEQISEYTPLLKAARPNVYRTNAFRVTGIDVDSSAAEISRQIQKLEMMERLGADSAVSTGPFALKPRPRIADVQEARRRLSDPELRIVDEFFWFWPSDESTSTSDAALLALRRGDIQSAQSIWQQRQRIGKDSCATHNLAVLNHLQALEQELSPIVLSTKLENPTDGQALWAAASANWQQLVSETEFWERFARRIEALDDPRLRPTVASRVRLSTPIALATIDATLAIAAAELGNFSRATSHLIRLRSCGLAEDSRRKLVREGVSGLRTRLSHLCKHAENNIATSPDGTPEILKKLLEDSKPFREILNYLLGAGDPVRDAAHDQIARTIRECLPQYGNKTKNYAACRALLKEASQLATSAYVQNLCRSDLDTVNNLVADDVMGLIVGACKDTEEAVSKNPANAERLIKKLLSDAEVLFRNLHKVTDPHSELRTLAYDWVARASRNCVVDLANATQNWSTCQYLLRECRQLAVSKELVQRIEDDLKVVQSNLSQENSSVNFVRPPHAPRYVDVPPASPPKAPSSIGRPLIGFIIAAIIILVLARACNSSSETGSGSSTPSSNSPAYTAAPSTSMSEAPTRTEETQTAGSSRRSRTATEPVAGGTSYSYDKRARIQALKSEVESGHSQVQQLESLLQRCNETLSYYSGLIEEDRRRLDKMKADNDLGVDVDEVEYQRIRARHNSNVELHNAELGNCRDISANYKRLLNDTNEKVDEYNRMIGER